MALSEAIGTDKTKNLWFLTKYRADYRVIASTVRNSRVWDVPGLIIPFNGYTVKS